MGKNIAIVLLAFIVVVLIVNSFFGLFTGHRNDMIAAEAISPKTDTIPLTRSTTPNGNPVVSYTPREGIIPSNNITAAYKDYVQDTLGPALKIKASDINDPDGRVKELLQINTGRSTLTYNYNATLDMVTEQKRTFFNDYLVTHITSPDSNMVINHVEHFRRITPIKPHRFGIGIQAGWHYVPSAQRFAPTLGVGVSYNFFRLP